MHIHAITFRIHNDATYATRYESVVDAIRALSPVLYWQEPTSFFLIESAQNSGGVAKSIDSNSSFNSATDLLVVINLSEKGYTPLGKVTDTDLKTLMDKR